MVIQLGAQSSDVPPSRFGEHWRFRIEIPCVPVIAYNLLLSIELYTAPAASSLNVYLGWGYVQNAINVEKASRCIPPCARIGYDKAARSPRSLMNRRTIRQVAAEVSGLDQEALQRLLDPRSQLTRAGSRSSAAG